MRVDFDPGFHANVENQLKNLTSFKTVLVGQEKLIWR